MIEVNPKEDPFVTTTQTVMVHIAVDRQELSNIIDSVGSKMSMMGESLTDKDFQDIFERVPYARPMIEEKVRQYRELLSKLNAVLEERSDE